MDSDTATQKQNLNETRLRYTLQSSATIAETNSALPTLRSLLNHDEVFLLGTSLLLMIIMLIG